MTDILVTGGHVVTQNVDREVIKDGAVAITDDTITAVGPASRVESETDPDRIIDADGAAVIPGLINAHTHVSDILLRGAFETDRGLYDWLFNVKQPGTLSMSPDEHATAAKLYCAEGIQAGMTTFVENDTEMLWDDLDQTHAKLGVYDEMGIRSIFGAGIRDAESDENFESLYGDIIARDPDTVRPPLDRLSFETETALEGVRGLIEEYHGSAGGRQSIWPSPVTLESATPEALRAAYDIAEEHDVMTTTHVSEAEVQEQGPMSSIEYLRNVGYLGDRALLGHCVQIGENDVRILAKTDTRVVHNIQANMRLATGFAPVVEMRDSGVTMGLGTDNSILSDTVNPLMDARMAASGHKGYHRDPGVVPAQQALDMVTREAAAAIGREDDLGSLESGTQADLAVVDLDHPHLTPVPDPVHALIYGLQGFEIDTVLCAGDIVMDLRELAVGESLSSILDEASETAEDIVERTNIV
ncbi:MAG: 5-methylthioadenosine/S-adenosylhomocysteine deaminase [Natronomonas sp.]|jgi:5-methylthioadenosine/S-adenosylhomocysteine deaminase